MLDEQLKRGFSMKVIKRKALTRNVIGRFDLSMPPHAGGWLCRGSSRTAPTMSAAHVGGRRVVLLSSLLARPHAGGQRGLNPAQGIESRPRCRCEEPRRGDVAIPLGIRRLPRPMPHVIWRYAVEGIASSLRRLAPRNDNRGTRAMPGKGEASLAPTQGG